MDQAIDRLRSLVQPITHNLPPPVRDLAASLLGDTCYTTLVHKFDPLSSPDCVRLAVSKALGLGIVGTSSVVKVPQLIKLLRSKSPDGISILSYLLETAAYLVSLAYNVRSGFPFSTYGESALIAVQNIAITAVVLRLSGRTAAAATFVGAVAVAACALVEDQAVDMNVLSILQAGAGALAVAAKVPQIVTIWREGGTGQLSAFAVFGFFFGSLARIFTTLQEVDDKLILYSFVVGFALNTVLALQMIYYWGSSPAKPSKKKNKSKDSNKKSANAASSEPGAAIAAESATIEPEAGASATPTPVKKRNAPSTRRRG